MISGKVVGMHQEGVHAVAGKLDQRKVKERLDDLEASMRSVARSVGQGGVGLLAKCSPEVK